MNLVTFPFLTCLASLLSGPAPQDLAVDDVARGLRAREEAVRNYAVRAEFMIESRSLHSGEYANSAAAYEIQYDRLAGRFRIHKIEQVYNAPGELRGGEEFYVDVEATVVHNGERTTTLRKLPGRDGEISEDPHLWEASITPGRQGAWVVDPEDLTFAIQGQVASQILERGRWDVQGTERLDGRDVLIVAGVPADGADDAAYSVKVWIDVDRNFIIPKHESYVAHPGEKPVLYFRSVRKDWSEPEPGIWLPGKYEEEGFQVLPGQRPFLMARKQATLSDWAINEPWGDALFRLEIPRGVLVSDQGRGTTYRTGTITEASIADSAREATRLREAFERTKASLPEPSGGVRWWWWAAGVAVAVAIVVPTARTLWRRARP